VFEENGTTSGNLDASPTRCGRSATAVDRQARFRPPQARITVCYIELKLAPRHRELRALSTSADRRVHRAYHDRHRVNQQNFIDGISLNDTVANAPCLILQNAHVSLLHAFIECRVPPDGPGMSAVRTSRKPDNLRASETE
jgi:hypothetical protein